MAVGANAGVGEDLWKLRVEEPDDVVRLSPTFEHHLRAGERIERRLDVRHVGQHEIATGEMHQEAVVPHEAIVTASFRQSPVHIGDDKVLCCSGVVSLDDEVQRAVDGRIGLADLESGFAGDRSIT